MTQTHACPKPVLKPQAQQLDYSGVCECFDQVSGNFYDFIPREKSRLVLALGDLVSAAAGPSITISCFKSLLRGLTAAHGAAIAQSAVELNRILHLISPYEFWATLFHASIDPLHRELRYVNAGSEAPLLIRRRARTYQRLEHTGPALGFASHTRYRSETAAIDPGDVLVALTQGLSSLPDGGSPFLSDDFVLDTVLSSPYATAAELSAHLLARMENEEQDRTVVVVRYPGPVERTDFLELAAAVSCSA